MVFMAFALGALYLGSKKIELCVNKQEHLTHTHMHTEGAIKTPA